MTERCEHVCCDVPREPLHEHVLPPENCASCRALRERRMTAPGTPPPVGEKCQHGHVKASCRVCSVPPTSRRYDPPDPGPPADRAVEAVRIDWPEPGTPPTPDVRAIMSALRDHATPLRELGHAHARLDANARHYIARLAVAALRRELSGPRGREVAEGLGMPYSGWSGHSRPDGSFGRVHDKNSVHMDGCEPLFRLPREGEG